MVHLTRGRYRMILRLTPVNFDLLSEGEQHVIENALMAACQGLDFPVQFLCTAEAVDTRAAMAELYSSAARETSAVRRNYADVLLSYLDTLMSQRSVLVRRSYAVIGCDGQPAEKARGILEHRAAVLAGALSRAKVTAVVLSSDEIVDLLHHLLNRNRAVRPSDLVGAGALDLCVSGKGVVTGAVRAEAEEGNSNPAPGGVLAG
ncbi:MAG: hypothetical protein PWP72_935 [Thermoanaerobacter sp.]|nr:hypothetical protein [Thermoanaerobacter sp.]